ncbi:MAG: hypothetical protein AB4368_25445 [Xenococcaceae cyanobacterium]
MSSSSFGTVSLTQSPVNNRLDLRQYNLGSVETPGSFQDIQQKGDDEDAWGNGLTQIFTK